jgi:hypothetical protein
MIHYAVAWVVGAVGKAVAGAITHGAVAHGAVAHTAATQTAVTHAAAAHAEAAVHMAMANPEVALDLALGHAAVAHPMTAALIGAGVAGLAVASVVYGDVEEFKKQLDAVPGKRATNSVQVSVAGKLANNKFVPTRGPFQQGTDAVLLAEFDEDKKEVTKKVFVKAMRVKTDLASALGGGNIVVFG